mgnify:CR=1 FL=1
MAKDSKSGEGELKVTPNYEKVLYTPERVGKWMNGEISLQELTAISGPEMLQMAIYGFQMYEQGKHAEARTVFSSLVSLDPKESYYLTALGAVHLAEEELDSAKSCFDQAIKLNPKELASYVNRGEVYLRQGKVLEAAEDFAKAVELDPKGEDPLTMRARLLAAAALETIEGAQSAAPKAAEKKPTGKTGSKPALKPAAKPAPKKK